MKPTEAEGTYTLLQAENSKTVKVLLGRKETSSCTGNVWVPY